MNFCLSNKRKISITLICSSLLFFASSLLAQPLLSNPDATSCNQIVFSLDWPPFVKPQQTVTYSMKTNSILDQQANIEYELWSQGKLIIAKNSIDFTYTFTWAWNYILKTILKRTEQCIYVNEQPITVADKIWLWIWIDEKESVFLAQTIKQNGVWFASISGIENSLDKEVKAKRIQRIAQILPISDVVFINVSQAPMFFDHIDDIRTYGIWFPERLILVWNMSQSVLRRLLNQAAVAKDFSQIALIPSPYISSIAQYIITNKPIEQLNVARVISTQQATNTWWMPLWKTVDALLKNWISLPVLLMILTIPLVVLCLVFLKQVVWINLWSLYYLLLLSGAIIFYSRPIALSMFLAALCAQIIVQIITKKVYLLFAPKMWMTIIVTIILYLLIMYWFQTIQWWSVLILPSQPEASFFPLIAISMMMQYIYPQHDSWSDKSWWWWLILLVCGVLLTTFLLNQTQIQQLLLWYPDLLRIILLLTLYLWRYSWLQMSEYFRFWPLIKKYLDDEE